MLEAAAAANPALPVTHTPAEGELLHILGSDVRILADARTTGGRALIFIESSQPGAGPPLHRHGIDDEFFYVLQGSYKFVMNGSTFLAEPGAFVSAPKGSLHTFMNLGPGPGKLLVISTPSGLENAFRETHTAAKAGLLNPEKIAEIFAKFDLTFHGPPLSAT